MSGGFQRINPIGEGTIRGPARLIVASNTIAFPANLAAMINMAASGAYVAAVETVSITGGPTGGTFTLSFLGIQTAPIAYNATFTAVAAALNNIAGVSSSGGVVCAGGPLPTTPVTVTFGVMGSQPLITAPITGFALTGGATPVVGTAMTTPGNGQYDVTPGSGWTELGSTRGGVNISKNNTETQLDVDQVYGSIFAVPDEHEMTVATQFAETTLENIALAWEGGVISVDATQTPYERHLPIGTPLSYTQRRLAVLHQKTIGPGAGLIRAVVFRNAMRSPANSALDYQKAGQAQTLAHTFRAFADWTISDQYSRFGQIIEQQLQ